MKLKSILFATLTSFAVAQASASSISTGVASWLVNGNSVVVESPIASPNWINNFGDGQWVGVTASSGSFAGGEAPGTYTFTLDMSSLGGAGTFNLEYAADNTIQWSITSGTVAGMTSCLGNPDVANCFGAGNGAPRMLNGTFSANSILTATVVNGSSPGFNPNPMGLLVVGTAQVPVPASLALFGLGAVALAAARAKCKDA